MFHVFSMRILALGFERASSLFFVVGFVVETGGVEIG